MPLRLWHPLRYGTRVYLRQNHTAEGYQLRHYLDERVVLFVITLHGKHRVSRCPCADIHLLHFVIEEIGKILLIDVGCNASNVKSARLA